METLVSREAKPARPNLSAKVEEIAMTVHFDSNLIRRLVRQEVQAELRRLASQEAALWATCFGPASPKTHGAKVERVMRIASARAVAAEMRAAMSADISLVNDIA